MAKQLLIYERSVPVSSTAHRDLSVQMQGTYGFARNVNSVPLLAAEFTAAASDYAIVFAGDGEAVFPAVILGIRENENTQIDAEGAWTGGYLPAFLRRYPFVFTRSEDQSQFILCIDEEFEGFNTDGRGERLFDSEGNRTRFLEEMLGFTREYQSQFERTRSFCAKLVAHDLLEPAHANFTLGDGQTAQLTGFQRIARDKLKALPDETLRDLMASDELELCYVHLQSLNTLSAMARKATTDDPKAA